MEFRERVFEAVRKIPAGKVSTYGDIAEFIGCPGGARAVGNALHTNTDSKVNPCHRVVSSSGRLAPNYAFGGAGEQAKRLSAEGVEVWLNRVDLKRFRADLKNQQIKEKFKN